MSLQCGRCGAAVQDYFASHCPGCGEALAPETLVRDENAPTIVSRPRPVDSESFGLPGENSPEAIEAARAPRWHLAVQAAFGALFFALGAIYMYHRFATWEVEGGSLYMPRSAWAMYKMLGKTGVAAAFFAMSALFAYFAFGVCYDWPGCKRSDKES